jgi:hypothetical protein
MNHNINKFGRLIPDSFYNPFLNVLHEIKFTVSLVGVAASSDDTSIYDFTADEMM